MRPSLLEIVVDPVSGEPLELEQEQTEGDEVLKGALVGGEGRRYPVVEGVPRFVRAGDAAQLETGASFGYKWTKTDSWGSPGMRAALHAWLSERYGFATTEEMRRYFGSRQRILDAGCGAGFATSAWMDERWNDAGGEWVGVDISSAIDVARSTLGSFPATHFVQADVMELPFRPASFDVVFSEGVLHHTPSTERAFAALVPLLAEGGELMIYVYRRKAPVREFTDDHVRERLAGLTPEQAWEALRPLTRLAQALAELQTEVEVPEDVPLLGIRSGRYDVQRLLYWHVAKLFWNPDLTFEENNHLNFDWYAPRYAHRHTEEEVRAWFERGGLELTRLDVHEAGFTARGLKGC
jgi:SAM-dependent methyltransferase